MPDHVHILARIKADISVSEALRSIKAGSSKWVHDAFREHRRTAWQKGYAAFSVSESQVPVIRRYIRNQEQHHAKSTFKAELIGLLRKHKIEYDE
jgi:REP element-mobilizing transposase RayT